MNKHFYPLPLSAVLMVLAFAASLMAQAAAGWLLFALGAAAWIRMDGKFLATLLTTPGKPLLELAAYSAPPLLALIAYRELAAGHADLTVSCALAFHALLVLGMLAASAHPVSEEKTVSSRI